MKTYFQLHFRVGFVLLLVFSSLCYSLKAQTLTATDNNNDAYIDLEWILPASCFNAGGGLPHPQGVFLELKADGKVIYTEIIKKITPAPDTNMYRHFVGPSKSINYSLTLYIIGPGTTIVACSNLTDAGSTTAFQPPLLVVASDGTFADRVKLSWQNKSKLSTNFILVRKLGTTERVIATVAGTTTIDSVLQFEDIYEFNDSTSLVNGEVYAYCIRTYSGLTKTTFDETGFPNICDNGNTFDIGLNASDFTFPNKVELTWNNASAFADVINIRRNGELIATLTNPTATTYTDNSPIYGDTSLYEVVLVKNNLSIISDSDAGGVDPIGAISGFVRNENGYGVAGVKVFYNTTIADIIYADSTVTDYTGAFQFSELFFGSSAIFTIKVIHKGFTIKPDSLNVVLSTATPVKTNNNFTSSRAYATGSNVIEITNFNATPGNDILDLNWNYTIATPDTVFFQLYREGQLIGIIDDAAGAAMQLTDRTAEPNFFYKYEIRGYALNGDSVVMASLKDTFQFPDVTLPTNVNVVEDFDANSMGVLTVTWDHTSNNFDGFRIYRNGTFLVEIADTSSRHYSDYMGNPGESYTYSVAAFRFANNIKYESIQVSTTNAIFPNFVEPTNVVATPDASGNAVLVTWNLPSAQIDDDNFTGFKILRNNQVIGEIIKGAPYEYKDLQGIPGTSYTYVVQLFVEQNDTIFFSNGTSAASVNFPVIDPLTFTATSGTGKITMSWSSTYNDTHQNYDGFIVKASGIGTDTLARYATSHAFYNKVNNSVSLTLHPYRNINGVIYEATSTTQNSSATNALNALEAPSNLTASRKYPMHVALHWEYPVYKLSEFIIYRDGIAQDTLPPTARDYYDYSAEVGRLYEYYVEAIYLNQLSDRVGVSGCRRNLGSIKGQILSAENGRGVDSLEVRLVNGASVLAHTFTNNAGLYIFEDLPKVAQQSSLTVAVQTTGRSTSLVTSSQVVSNLPIVNQDITINFQDNFLLPLYPPRAQRDSVAQILAVDAMPLKNKRGVLLSWATSEGFYEGINAYRGFTKLPANNQPSFLEDKGGFGGIQYFYPVSAFGSVAGAIETATPGVDSVIYPTFMPVENLSATPSYAGKDNTVIINWSHCTGEVSFYQVERNDQVLGLINFGQPLTFEDNTGSPNQQYIYTVRAGIQNGNQLIYSDPVSVMILYPEVASPAMTLVAVQDSNAVRLDWSYKGDYVNGFRVYRDGNLIANLSATDTLYYDLEGFPDTLHKYSVEAVLERGDMLFFSKSTSSEIIFPKLKAVSNLTAQTNTDLGNVDLMFNYYARGVDKFEIMYTVTYAGGTQDTTLMFEVLYSELANHLATFRDELAIPGVAVNYMVTAVSVRNNVEYRSPSQTVTVASYPSPPVPLTFTASDGTYPNRVEFDWTLPFDANIDGFILIKLDRAGNNASPNITLDAYLTSLGTNLGAIVDTMQIGPGRRTYAEVINEIGNNTSANTNYILVSFNEAYGVLYYSNVIANNGYAGIQRQVFTNISPSMAGGTFGWSVAIDGNNAIVGAPFSNGDNAAATGNIVIYNQVNDNWESRFNYISTANMGEYGKDVDVFGDLVAIGSPGSYGSTDIGRIDLIQFNFSTGATLDYEAYDGSAVMGQLGENIAINGNYVYANWPGPEELKVAKRSGGNYTFLSDEGPASQSTPYVSLAAADTYILAGAATDVGTVKGYVDIYKRDGDNVFLHTSFNGENMGDNFGTSVDIDGVYAVVGAIGKNGKGAVYIYQINSNGQFDNIQIIEEPNLPNNASGDRFGWSVSIKGDYLLVGARDHQGLDGKSQQGVAFLFKREGNLFEYVDVITVPKEIGGVDDEFGFSVDIGTTDMIIGAPYHGSSGSVFFFSNDLKELWHQKLSNVQATDGTLPNQTRITWNFSGNRDYINGFAVYRDDEKIATVDAPLSLYFDTDGVPGQEYTYTIRVITSLDRESIGQSDKGFRPGIGSLEGAVQTLFGFSPVPDVTITAEGIAGGEKYTYTGITNNDGSVTFRNVFIGTDTITYTFTASYENHEFNQNPIKVALSTQNTFGKALFIDKTAFVATGNVQLAGVTCGIDSVRVRALSTFQNGNVQVKETYTNSEGTYTLVLEPDAAGLQKIEIVIDSTHAISRKVNDMERRDSVLHKFKASASTVFTNFSNFPITNKIDFVDTLTYEVKLFVTTVCKTPASNNGLFNIEISTRDGCFQQFYQTGINGRVNAKLPALDDLIVTVKEVTPAQVANILIVDYLRYRPNTLDLLTIHLDNRTKKYDAVTLDSLTFQRLVYHKPPEITLLTSISRVFCGSDDLVPVITQNEEYSFDFSVQELHNGFNCQVDEGYLVINNSAATNDRDTLQFLPGQNKFETHNFIAGLPNLVSPYRKGISIKYFSANNDFLGELIIPIIVEGSTTLPGSDILVDLGDPDGQFKFISYILRDPPGDGSFSSIAENTTTRKTYADVNRSQGSAGVDTDIVIATPAGGFYTKGQISGGGSQLNRNSFEIISTTSQTISTSNAPNFVGPDADVIVGLGVAYRYGIGETLVYNDTTCTMQSIREFTFGPDSIKTDWFYTVGILKQFVKELKAQQAGVQAGTVTISIGGQQLSPIEATQRLQTQIENWESVLNYHAVTSLPHVMFCSETPTITIPDNESNNDVAFDALLFKTTREANAKTARNAFCNLIGTYTAVGDTFKLNDTEVLFNETLKNKYMEAVTKASYWVDSLSYTYSEVNSIVSNLAVSSSYFPEIENTTFSAGTTIIKTATSTTTSSDLYEQRGFFILDQALGFALGAKGATGVGIGVVAEVQLADVKNRLGVVIKATYEGGTNEETVNSNTVTHTYTLNDNDPGDQFSVTAIKGQNPSHSPYFQLFGGRSSCPPEPGTIFRDNIELDLIDLPTQATFDEQTLNDIDPDKPARFNVQIANRSPFGENRDIFIYHDAPSNEEGATILLGGQRLGGSNESGQTLNFLNPNQPYILPLDVERAPGKYQFENIGIVARASCPDGNSLRTSVAERDTVKVSAFFQHPCSPITIASPGDNWVIRRRNPFIPQSRETLILEIRDYQASNPVLEEMYLEVRRIGDGSGWQQLPLSELDPDYIVLNDSLINFNQQNFAPGDIPKFFFVWDITELYDKYPDGDYEIRAVSFCGSSGVLFSNVIKGKISRSSTDIFAITQPADGIWQRGDEISIQVNKELDCALVNQMNFTVYDLTTGLPVPGTIGCFFNDNKLIFQPTNIALYDDRMLRAIVDSLRDETGNIYLDSFVWDFKVIYRDIFVEDDTLATRLYKGNTGILTTNVFANQQVGTVNFAVEESYPWLVVTPSPSTTNSVAGRELTFTIDTDNLPLGDTSAVIVVRSSEIGGGTDTIRLLVTVIPTPPNWVVDPTDFSDPLPTIVIANWKYTTLPGLANDTLDLISAWIGNEIRGVAPITNAGGNFYAAYLAVYGNSPADAGKPIEFRVWDASMGMEYDARPVMDTISNIVDTIRYQSGTTYGNVQMPKILIVDPSRDKARYIPLNANGWTWFSLNSQEQDMRVNRMLRELQNNANGDIIRTRQKSASYLVGTGWVSSGGLDTMNVIDGYAIFRSGTADSIRITGRDARYPVIPLDQGWNFVGYPRQDVRGINDILDLLTPTNLDQVFTSRSLLDSNAASISQYIASSTTWLPNTFNFKPNRAYQVQVGVPTIWVLEGSVANPLQDTKGALQKNLNGVDPNNPATWAVNPANYSNTMVILADLAFDGNLSVQSADKIGAFVNGECRGVANLQYVAELNRYIATLFVYANRNGESIEFRLFNSKDGQLYRHTEKLAFNSNNVIGNLVQPYHFVNLSLPQATLTATSVLCATDSSATVRINKIEGGVSPYKVRWENGYEGMERSNLSAGRYRVVVTDNLGQVSTDSIEVVNQQLTIPQPIIELNGGNAICRETDIWIAAESEFDNAIYRWYDKAGQLLIENELVTLTKLTKDTALWVETVVNGCISERVEVPIQVQAPDADFEVLPSEIVQVGDTVYLYPTATINTNFAYTWSLDQYTISRLPQIFHVYQTPGLYDITLRVTDTDGCETTVTKDNYLQVLLSTDVKNPVASTLRLSAQPNPFSRMLTAITEVENAGDYELIIRDITGRALWSQKHFLSTGRNETQLDLRTSGLAVGTYFLELINAAGEKAVVKIIKQANP